MNEWIDVLVRRAAMEVVGSRQFKGTLLCTAYNPKTHAVKGIIVPHGIESGWVPVATHHAGNGFGVLMGPKVGSGDNLSKCDQFDIEFDLGDPNTIVARHRQFSTLDKPPEVQSGEMLLQHESGNKVFFDKGNNITLQHHAGAKLILHDDKSITLEHASGTSIAWDKDGNITHDAKDKTLTVAATKGGTINLGQGAGSMSVSTIIDLAAGSTIGGLPIKTA